MGRSLPKAGAGAAPGLEGHCLRVEMSDRWRQYRSLAVSYLLASEYEEPR
jgi:hypothetical protein